MELRGCSGSQLRSAVLSGSARTINRAVRSLLSAERRIEPGRVGVVPETFHAFDVAVGKAVITPSIVAKLRTAPVRITANDAVRAISCLGIAQHPGP